MGSVILVCDECSERDRMSEKVSEVAVMVIEPLEQMPRFILIPKSVFLINNHPCPLSFPSTPTQPFALDMHRLNPHRSRKTFSSIIANSKG